VPSSPPIIQQLSRRTKRMEAALRHPSPAASVEQCVQCAQTRACPDCFEELVRRFQSPLMHFLFRRIGSRHDAEDLLQETFLLAHRKLASYKSCWQFSTWLFTIANRQAASRIRRRRWLPIFRLVKATPIDPQSIAQDNEWHSKLWDEVSQILEADAFTAVWLSYVEAMPADQIGHVLNRSANGVRILLHRSRCRLAQRLGDQWKRGDES